MAKNQLIKKIKSQQAKPILKTKSDHNTERYYTLHRKAEFENILVQ